MVTNSPEKKLYFQPRAMRNTAAVAKCSFSYSPRHFSILLPWVLLLPGDNSSIAASWKVGLSEWADVELSKCSGFGTPTNHLHQVSLVFYFLFYDPWVQLFSGGTPTLIATLYSLTHPQLLSFFLTPLYPHQYFRDENLFQMKIPIFE